MRLFFLLVRLFTTLTANAIAEVEVCGSTKVDKKSAVHDWVAEAKVSATEIVRIASEAVSGNVVELTLEEDDGFLVNEVSVATLEHTFVESEADAGTGEILDGEIAD